MARLPQDRPAIGVDPSDELCLFGVGEERRRERIAGEDAEGLEGEGEGLGDRLAVLVEITAEANGIVRLQGDEQAALDQVGERVVGEVGDDAEARSRFVVATGVYSTRNVAWQARHWAEIA